MLMIARTLVLAIAATGLIVAAGRPARSADYLSPALGSAQQAPESQIEITRVFAYTAYWDSYLDTVNPRASFATAECVNFVNRGPKLVSRVLFGFWMLSPQGGRTANEALLVAGRFPPGEEQHKTRSRGPHHFEDECREINRALSVVDGALRDDRPGPRHPKPADGPLQLMARVDKVTYADGTVWQAPAL